MENEKKISPFKIALAILLVAVLGVGVYGTIIGIKATIKDNKEESPTTTTMALSVGGAEKTFKNGRFSITLTSDFKEKEDSALEAFYSTDGAEVLVLKESFEEYPESKNLTVEEYLNRLIMMNGDVNAEILEDSNGVYYVEYLYSGSGKVQRYSAYAFKTDDAFWTVDFIYPKRYTEKMIPYVEKWASTVEISDAE
jgi:hypothetical protein